MHDALPLLQVRNLVVEFRGRLSGRSRRVRALNGISLDVLPCEVVGIVGESGCGKTTLGRTLLGLERPTCGEIRFEGRDLAKLKGAELRAYRREVQMIFQNPISSLDPRMKVKDLVAEPLVTHTNLRGPELVKRVIELLELVGLEESHLDRYSHALSGGQAQRVAIARALALNPKFLVLDEPTSALDVSVQAQIINLLKALQRQRGMTYLFISHDLAVVQYLSHRTAVMYLGAFVEKASSRSLFSQAQHPYTQALLSATPQPDPTLNRRRIVLPGSVPDPGAPPPGCVFHPRCPMAKERCKTTKPRLVEVEEGHWVACHACTGGS